MEAPEVTEIKANCNNKEYVLKAVGGQGKLLEWASDELRDDEEVVKTALENDGEAMEFASDRLKDNKDLMLLAIKGAPWTACYASDRLRADRDVIMASVKTYGQTLYFASEELRDDYDVVKAAVSNKGIIVKYASFRLRDNEEIVKITGKTQIKDGKPTILADGITKLEIKEPSESHAAPAEQEYLGLVIPEGKEGELNEVLDIAESYVGDIPVIVAMNGKKYDAHVSVRRCGGLVSELTGKLGKDNVIFFLKKH